MNERPGVVQRAFQIAKTGEVTSLAALHARLAAECYLNSGEILAGRSVSLHLTRIIVERSMVKRPIVQRMSQPRTGLPTAV